MDYAMARLIIKAKSRRDHPLKENFKGKPYSIEEIMKKHPDEFGKCLLVSNLANCIYFTPCFFFKDKCYGFARGSKAKADIGIAVRNRSHKIWKYFSKVPELSFHHPVRVSLRRLAYKLTH